MGPSPALLMRHRIMRNRWMTIGLLVVAGLALVALAAPWLAPRDPYHGQLVVALREPSPAYLFGTDAQGRDVLSRVLFGARLSLAVGVTSQVIALAAGLTLGLAAGYRGRWVDAVVMRAADVTLAFPSLLLLIAIAAAVKPSLPVVCLVIGLVGWAGMARLVRGQVLVVRGLDYVHAARALGASGRRLVTRHVLPNILGPVVVAATLGVGGAIMAEAALSWTADTVYLNNASTGPIPERTRRALDEFTAQRTAPHLLPDRELQAGLQAARAAVAHLINADASEIALATNTSHGLNLAARALPLQPGDVALVSDREFPANVYPWLLLKKQGVEVELAPCTAQGWPDEDYLVERLHDPRVRVLAVSFVQFANGHRADLDRLGAACRANGTFLVVDGIQGVGNSVLDVRETPVDILACGGQKWLLAPWGSGFVYVRRELISVLEPAVAGWMAFEGTDDFSRLTEYNPTFRSDARRFEMVTLPYQDFYGMTASVGMLAELGIDDIAQYARTLHEPVCRWADETGVRVVSPRAEAHRSAIICLAPAHPVEAYHALKRAHVVCSLREGAIRLAPHCYNTVEELERVLDVLDQLE